MPLSLSKAKPHKSSRFRVYPPVKKKWLHLIDCSAIDKKAWLPTYRTSSEVTSHRAGPMSLSPTCQPSEKETEIGSLSLTRANECVKTGIGTINLNGIIHRLFKGSHHIERWSPLAWSFIRGQSFWQEKDAQTFLLYFFFLCYKLVS